MRPKRVDHGEHMDTAKLTTAACASYAANATLGFAVATKVVDTSKAKWLHHGLYISTFALTGAVVWTAVGPLVLSARSALTKKPRGVIAGRESAASLPPVRIPSKNARKENSGGLAGWLLLPDARAARRDLEGRRPHPAASRHRPHRRTLLPRRRHRRRGLGRAPAHGCEEASAWFERRARLEELERTEALMDLFDAIRRRKTTNGPFLPDPVSEEHQRLLVELAGRRAVPVEQPAVAVPHQWRTATPLGRWAPISGESMTEAMSNGTFFERYKPYFRFSAAEMEQSP
jgi:hypothetical protein